MWVPAHALRPSAGKHLSDHTILTPLGTTRSTCPPNCLDSRPTPPSDHIFEFLYYYRPTLGSCCIVSKSWIPHVRKHLFSFVSLNTPAHLERWKRSFPDNSCTPAHYTRTLVIGCLEAATDADAGEGGWIRTFSRVTRLVLNNISACFNYPTVSLTPFHGFSPVLKSFCKFSTGFLKNSQILFHPTHLEDLSVTSTEGDVDPPGPDMPLTTTQPSHPFTGTLDLAVSRGVDTVTHWLLSRPNGLHFRHLVVLWLREQHLRSINALVWGCVDTLENLTISYYPSGAVASFPHQTRYSPSFEGEPGPAVIDLSGAKRLKSVSFLVTWSSVKWIILALQTVTHEHRDFRQMFFRASEARPRLPGNIDGSGIRKTIGEPAFNQWLELDHLLVKFWDTHSIRLKVSYNALRDEWKKIEVWVKCLLPEMAKRGLIDSMER